MNTKYHLNRFLLGVATAISFALFWFVGAWFNIPGERGFNVSLLTQPSAISAIVIVAIAILASTVICTLVSGSVRTDAGLFCTALGLMAISLRGGSMRSTLVDAKPPVFFALAIELILLYAIFAIGWMLISRLRDMGFSNRDDKHFKPNAEDFTQKLIATAIQAVATLAMMSILCRTDEKKQALAAVGIASMIGSIVATMVAPTRPSIWYWPGPLLVGLLGYLWASMNPQHLSIGQPAGYFASLARALPIDYASSGIAGAMLGYWFGRAWSSETDDQTEPAETSTPAATTVSP